MSAFSFIDKLSEAEKDQGITAFFTLKGDEEFLKDHFEGFPVMPGVLLLESVKQASAVLLDGFDRSGSSDFRLDEVQQVKFGQFVRPGTRLRITSRLVKKDGARALMEGRIDVVSEDGMPAGRALSADFWMAPVPRQERTSL